MAASKGLAAMKMRAALTLCVLGAFGGTPALAEEYSFDLRKNHPVALAAWVKQVPSTYRTSDWVYRLDGTTSPMEEVTMQGRVFYYGSVCKPHDCGGNNVVFLIADDGSAAYGLLASETLGVKARIFGAPDAEARQLLGDKLAQ